MFLLCILAAVIGCSGRFELFDYNPVASASQQVVSGNARFTVLTDRVIRLEYAAGSSFVDDATLAFVNRNLNVSSFTSSQAGGVLTIQTSYLTLTYTVGQAFGPRTLNITVKDASVSTYHYGDVDHGNLLGTIKSLDELGVIPLNCTLNANVKVHDESLHCEWGLISRNGWTTVDDSQNWLLDPKTGWWTVENPNLVDLYFFGHGNKYLDALQDYVKIGGNIAMPPRAANGVFWSRWYNMNDKDVLDLVDDYENRGLPLDCYILDMDWHTKQGWGGYTFDEHLFPLSGAVLQALRARGILTSGNLHDDDGVRPNEAQYGGFCKAIGVDPSQNQTISFAISNMTYALALEDQVLKPLEDGGFGDFWWIDWQQGGTEGGCKGGKMNPTIWLNRLRASDKIRRGQTQRGMVLARWGGLGNHRYQVGFSGDVQDVTWTNLAFQPYFSLTAANVLYGFWSHDIVSEFRGSSGYDYELYTRWVQWGAFSSVMRSHDRGMASGTCSQADPATCAIVKVWEVPTPNFEANRAALQERHRLLPYLYNAQRLSYDTGISLMRPLYYYWPDEPSAYLADQNGNFPQYMLGDNIMVAPIVSSGFLNDTLARQTLWIPPGTWIDELTGDVYSFGAGGQTIVKAYDLSEVPRFVQAGSVIPRLPLQLGNTVARALQQYTSLEFKMYFAPGISSGSVQLYEDDAISTAYATSQAFYTTEVAFARSANTISITVGAPSAGSGYADFPAQRDYTFRFVASPPQTVSLNGNSQFSYSVTGGANTWRFDGDSMEVVLQTGLLPTNQAFKIVVTAADTSFEPSLFGLKGQIRRANLAKRTLDTSWSTPGAQIVQKARLSDCASTGVALSFLAYTNMSQFTSRVLGFDNLYASAVSEVLGLKPSGSFPDNALVQWWNEDRQDNCLCAHNACNAVQAQSGYQFVRIEGYVPDSSEANTTPLFDYWNSAISDNLATSNPVMPAGYSAAIFSNGAVFSQPQDAAVALQTWWSEARQDWLTVASDDGIEYAKANGYVLGSSNVGFVYTQAPFHSLSKRDSTTPPTDEQWARAFALLTQ